MKKVLLISVSALLLLNSCGTYTADGAVTGGWFGSVIGSAIGGISGGHRGSNVGSLIGMAGGAVIGAAVGQAADQAEQRKYEEYKMSRQRTNSNRNNDYSYHDNSGYDASNTRPLHGASSPAPSASFAAIAAATPPRECPPTYHFS